MAYIYYIMIFQVVFNGVKSFGELVFNSYSDCSFSGGPSEEKFSPVSGTRYQTTFVFQIRFSEFMFLAQLRIFKCSLLLLFCCYSRKSRFETEDKTKLLPHKNKCRIVLASRNKNVMVRRAVQETKQANEWRISSKQFTFSEQFTLRKLHQHYLSSLEVNI